MHFDAIGYILANCNMKNNTSVYEMYRTGESI